MKSSRRCKTTILRPVALLGIGLIILTVTLWLPSPQLGHASASANTSAYANSLMANGKVDATFSGGAGMYKPDSYY